MTRRPKLDELVILGDAFSEESNLRVAEFGKFPLVICDPGYGEITKERWDVANYFGWMTYCTRHATESATIAMWGGIGKPGHRPFVEFADRVEGDFRFHEWEIKNWITWKKKRAYGVQDNYLFTREECLILTRGEPTFNIPLLAEKRPYEGYNEKYPAKSEYYRRTNVWTDITEILRGKIHPTQKPDALYEVLIATHTNEGDTVLDPCAGSCTTARAAKKLRRGFVCIEADQQYLDRAGVVPS